jgi:hypothetical protein
MGLWAWLLLLVFVYILVVSPQTALYLLSLPVKLIAGLGNWVVTVIPQL